MEQSTPTPSGQNQITMTYGAYVGGLLSVIALMSYLIGNFHNNPLQILNYIVIIGGLHIGTVKFRDNYNQGTITYAQALGTGTLIIFYGAVISGFFLYILYKFIDPSLIDQYLNTLQQTMSQSFSSDQVESLMPMYEMMITPFTLAIGELIGKTILGFLLALILSIFIKREPASPAHKTNDELRE